LTRDLARKQEIVLPRICLAAGMPAGVKTTQPPTIWRLRRNDSIVD